MKLSFVIPCYRSFATIEDVCDEIISVVTTRKDYDYEIITINDCSPDNVMEKLTELAGANSKIKVIDLAKNMGKHCALMAGFRYASGDYVICGVESALYEAGAAVPSTFSRTRNKNIIIALDAGHDVAMAQYGVKAQSKFKNFGSWMNSWMMETFLQKPSDFQFANFAAMKAFVIKEITKYNHPYAYINGLLLRTTKNMVNVPMQERERTVGVGGYTLKKSLALWINGITAFSVAPLRFASYLGVGSAVLGVLMALYVIIRKIIHPEIFAGWTSIMACLLLLGGIILVVLGLIGEYIGRIYICINEAPQYVIRSTQNLAED